MPMSGDNFAHRYAVVADTRRRWSEDEKQAIIGEALQPGVNVSAVARRHGIKPKPFVSLAEGGTEGSEAGPRRRSCRSL